MSASDFTERDPRCPSCGYGDVDPHMHFGGDIDASGRPVDVYGYICRGCGERFQGFCLQQPEPDHGLPS